MTTKKLQPKPFSKRTAEREDRDYHRCMGLRFPTHTSARKMKREQQAAFYESLSDICPN